MTPPSATPILRARDVRKSYRLGGETVAALRGVDLDVAAGELVVIAGPSGSGKSTLFHLLGALDEPDGGSIELEGRSLGGMGEGERTLLRRRRLGFVFQAFNLVPVLSARENVEYPLLLDGLPKRERERRAAELLAAVGLGARVRHRPDQLSGGERQRVALARALVHAPAVVLADEPTASLDSATGNAIVSLLEELNRERGTTFLVASHDPAVISRAPRRVRMRDGRVESDERSAA